MLPSMAGMRLALDEFGAPAMEVLRAGQIVAVDDVNTHDRCAPYAHAYLANGVRSCLGVPLLKDGRLKAISNVHHPTLHQWTELEIAMADDMVDRAWAAVESARAQSRLPDERDRSQYIFDSMLEGFAVLDRHWTILRMNAEELRLTQTTADRVIGSGAITGMSGPTSREPKTQSSTAG